MTSKCYLQHTDKQNPKLLCISCVPRGPVVASTLNTPLPPFPNSRPPPPPSCEQQAVAAAFLQGKPDMINAAAEGLLDVIAARVAIMGDDVNQVLVNK